MVHQVRGAEWLLRTSGLRRRTAVALGRRSVDATDRRCSAGLGPGIDNRVLGKTHAAFGVTAFGGATLLASTVFGYHGSLAQLGAGTVVAAGSALAPDLDEAGSTPGRALPLSHLPIFGGHRTRTHTLAAVLLVSAAAAACSFDAIATATMAALTATMGATWAFAIVRRHGALFALGAGTILGIVVAKFVGDGWWLVLATGPPYFSHFLGDAMTPGGVPFFMPISSGRWSLRLFRTGRTGEKVLVAPAMSFFALAAIVVAARSTLGG